MNKKFILFSILILSTLGVQSQEVKLESRLKKCLSGENVRFEFNFKQFNQDTVILRVHYKGINDTISVIFTKNENVQSVRAVGNILQLTIVGIDEKFRDVNIKTLVNCDGSKRPTKHEENP